MCHLTNVRGCNSVSGRPHFHVRRPSPASTEGTVRLIYPKEDAERVATSDVAVFGHFKEPGLRHQKFILCRTEVLGPEISVRQ